MKIYIIEKKDNNKRIADFFREQELDFLPVAYSINKELVPHHTQVKTNDVVESYSMTHKLGYRVYVKSLIFLLHYTINELLPKGLFEVSHTISKGIYCSFKNGLAITESQVLMIKSRMKELIKQNIFLEVNDIPREEAIEILKKLHGKNEKWQFGDKFPEVLPIYTLGNYSDYFYGPLVESTSLLESFDLHYFMPGFVIRFARRNNPEKLFAFKELPKFFDVLEESNKFTDILDITAINSINEKIINGQGKRLILTGEALQEKKISRISEHITSNALKYQLIMISGPSSSGKTTFSKKLETALYANGQKPIVLSLDDFYVNRSKTPIGKDGKPDYESIYSIDLDLFQNVLAALISGEEVEIPKFNFAQGERYYNGTFIKKDRKSPIIIEGIHGLNPKLTSKVPIHLKYFVYVTSLTQVNLDRVNHVKTTDARLIRRIIRDNRDRSFDIERTLSLWPNVRKGEETNIFKYQEYADIMFNSNLPYELNVLKPFAEPLLAAVTKDSKYYMDARHLLNVLRYFEPLETTWIPSSSLLREFIGHKYD